MVVWKQHTVHVFHGRNSSCRGSGSLESFVCKILELVCWARRPPSPRLEPSQSQRPQRAPGDDCAEDQATSWVTKAPSRVVAAQRARQRVEARNLFGFAWPSGLDCNLQVSFGTPWHGLLLHFKQALRSHPTITPQLLHSYFTVTSQLLHSYFTVTS